MNMRAATAATVIAVGLGTAGLGIHHARAADPGVTSAPSATLTLDAKAAAAGVGYTWGDGTLIYKGEKHRFGVKGITVADVGFSEIVGHGRVYHLNKLSDFSGTYAAATGEATVGTGLGGQILQNDKGVMIRVDEITKGARLSGSADGIQLTLEN
jgi:hypothetical protein